MPTPFLALNITGTPQVKRCVNGQVTNVTGSAASGTAETTAGANSLPYQRVIRFLGRNTFVQLIHQKIQRSTDAGATWSDVHSDSDLSSGAAKAGPHLCYVGGVPTLVVVANLTGTTEWNMWTSTDGSSWTKTGPFALLNGNNLPVTSIVLWRGVLYGFCVGTGSACRTLVADPGAGSLAMTPMTAPNYGQGAEHAMCVFKNRLFSLFVGTSGTRILSELILGSWASWGSLGAGTGSVGTGAKFCLFEDPATETLIAIFHTQTPNQWYVFKVDEAMNFTDITTDVAINSVLSAPATSARMAPLVDGPQAPGGDPGVYLFVAPNGTATTPFTVLRWNGISTPISAIGAGGDVAHAMPFGVQSGGSVFWTDGQRHVERVSASPVQGGVQWGIKLYSPNGSPDYVDVCWFLGEARDSVPGTPKATLSNPSTGSIADGDTWTGLDAADNGSTTFTVVWEAEDDGFGDGDWVKSVPHVSPT